MLAPFDRLESPLAIALGGVLERHFVAGSAPLAGASVADAEGIDGAGEH